MIFRPVKPVSAWGPPRMKRPEGLMRYSVSPSLRYSAGMAWRTTSRIRSSLSCSCSTSGECWAETTTVFT
jgi:hypothetical protein